MAEYGLQLCLSIASSCRLPSVIGSATWPVPHFVPHARSERKELRGFGQSAASFPPPCAQTGAGCRFSVAEPPVWCTGLEAQEDLRLGRSPPEVGPPSCARSSPCERKGPREGDGVHGNWPRFHDLQRCAPICCEAIGLRKSTEVQQSILERASAIVYKHGAQFASRFGKDESRKPSPEMARNAQRALPPAEESFPSRLASEWGRGASEASGVAGGKEQLPLGGLFAQRNWERPLEHLG